MESLSVVASEKAFIDGIPARVDKASYIGKLLLPGNDVTIRVTKARITIYVDGRQAKIGRACKFILAYANNIRSATKRDLESGTERIDIIGVWHQNGPNNKSFEPYLVQKVDVAGKATTSLYRYLIFHFDHHRSGENHVVEIEDLDDPRETIEQFKAATENLISLDQLPDYVWQNGHPCGILWCPVPGSDLPPFAYKAVGLRKFRTSTGTRLNPDEAAPFDAAKYQRTHDIYQGLISPTRGTVQ